MFPLKCDACFTFMFIDLAHRVTKPCIEIWPACWWHRWYFLEVCDDAFSYSPISWYVFDFSLHMENAKIFTNGLYSWAHHCFDPNGNWTLGFHLTRLKCVGKQSCRLQLYRSCSFLSVSSWLPSQVRNIYLTTIWITTSNKIFLKGFWGFGVLGFWG